jgi:hypothetical protein
LVAILEMVTVLVISFLVMIIAPVLLVVKLQLVVKSYTIYGNEPWNTILYRMELQTKTTAATDKEPSCQALLPYGQYGVKFLAPTYPYER